MKVRSRLRYSVHSHVPGFRDAFRYFGERIYFPRGSHLFYRVCLSGVYEGDLVEMIVNLMEPTATMLDVGANIGLMAVPVLKRLPDCQVVSFEPSPSSLPYLERTAREGSLSARWQIIGQMASDSVGESNFALADECNGAFEGAMATGRVKVAGYTTVRKTTVDTEWNRLGRPQVSVIKIDVEGAESSVLTGARECISKCRPFVLLEWNKENLAAYGTDPRELYLLAHEQGYHVCRTKDLCFAPNAASIELWVRLGEENFLLVPQR